MEVTNCRYIVGNGQEEHAMDLVKKFLCEKGVQDSAVEFYKTGVISVDLNGLGTTVKDQLNEMMKKHFIEASYLGPRM